MLSSNVEISRTEFKQTSIATYMQVHLTSQKYLQGYYNFTPFQRSITQLDYYNGATSWL